MHQILKRLELIKTSIAIEDEEIIELQIAKLSPMGVDADVKNILEKLSNHDYGSVIADIESYLVRYSGVVVYEDKEIQGLKLELKVLENQLQELSEQKNDYLNELNEFNTQYTLRLGELIQNILNLKKEIQYRFYKAKEAVFQSIMEEYEEAKEEYQELKTQKEELEKEISNIDEFDDRYDELYEELQELKVELEAKEQEVNQKRKNAKEAKEELDNDEDSEEYEAFEEDYKEFSSQYETVKKQDRFELNEEEQAELKKLFRKASKLCHPDIVADELREQATDLMQQLNDAYSKKDLKKIREILYNLENGKTFDIASDTINDKERLKEKIKDVRERIDGLKEEIDEIKSDETYLIIQDVDDLDSYFDRLKSELQEEYDRLQNDTTTMQHLESESISNIEPQTDSKEHTVTLTAHQTKIFNQVIDDIKEIVSIGSIWGNMISLIGSAGVGKTYMTAEIIKHLQELKLSITLTTPTHKALMVSRHMAYSLKIKLIRMQTIQSFLNVKLQTNYETGKRGFVVEQKGRDKSFTDVLIVDESSMINEDLFMHIDQAVKEGRVKSVLFVGDHYQLPPVDGQSIVVQKLAKQYELEEIIRQSEDSYIIKIASVIRDLIKKKDFSIPIETLFQTYMDQSNVHFEQNEFLSLFFSNEVAHWSEKEQIFIAYTNQTVDYYNKIARNRFWNEKGVVKVPQFLPGDWLTLQDANVRGESTIHQNNETILLKTADKVYDEELGIWYWECLDEEFKEINIVDEDSLVVYNEQLNKMMKDAKSKQGDDRKSAWKKYYGVVDQFCKVKYTYASTVHKTQGSTYPTVFVDLKGIIKLYNDGNIASKELAYRLTYVAVTRASSNVHVLY